MKFHIVTQGKNWKIESEKGIIVSPNTEVYSNLLDVKKGDVLFHNAGGLYAISIVLSDVKMRDNSRYFVETEYFKFPKKVTITGINLKEQIKDTYLDAKKYPFTIEGIIKNKGYIWELSVELVLILLKHLEIQPTMHEYLRQFDFIKLLESFYIEELELQDNNQNYFEGREIWRTHKVKERNRKLVRDAKEDFLKRHDKLFCEACGFSFSDKYSNDVNNYIEAHHMLPIKELEQETIVKIDSLVMLCSNCHRMVHAKINEIENREDLQSIFKEEN